MPPFDPASWTTNSDELRSVWRATVFRTVLPGLLTIVLFFGAIFTVALPTLKNALMQSKRDMAREMTTTAWGLLKTYESRISADFTIDEAQRQAIAQLRELRYGPEGKDYFWVNDMQPVMVMHPYRTELEGTDISEFQDVEGKKLFSEMVAVVESDGEGFVDYMWWWKDSDRIESKISFVKGFESWGWIVGTGIYIDDVQAEIAVARQRLLLTGLGILAVVVLLVGYMIWQARAVEERRVRAELSLRTSERKFRSIFHGAAQFIGLLDGNGILLDINDTALERVDRSAEQVCGRPLGETPWFTQHPQALERLRVALDDSRSGRIGHFELEMFGADYDRVLMDFSTKPILDRHGELANIVVEGWDITEMSELQEKLRQSQKMEAVGQLAGGVAHDFNNILMGIMGHAELLLQETEPGSSQAEALRLIVNASTRAGDLTRQLLSFSRKGKLETRPLDLHAVIREVAALLAHSIDRRISIALQLDAPRYVVSGDPSMLQNAILNLGVNARDAMASDKVPAETACRLTFATRVVEPLGTNYQPKKKGSRTCAGQPIGELVTSPTGPCLELTVTDTGCGIDPAIQEMIFEPFFTTKAPGEGTGLGLAGVFGCMQSHGGAIELESTLGAGATFRVLLPLSDSAVEPVMPIRSESRFGTGHILLVDDEEILRNFARVALTRLGYQVTVCSDGLEALEYYQDHHGQVDLVILDLIMNRMGGEEAFRQMKQVDPEVKVLISSGYSRDNVVSELMAEGAQGFLSKPYKLGGLSREVARVIGVPEKESDE